MTTSETLAVVAQRLGNRLMDVLVPCRCLHCHDTEPGAMPLGLCTGCRGRLEPLPSPSRGACDLCGRVLHVPKASTTLRCVPCMTRRSPLDRLYCAWRYEEPLNAVIQGLKFHDLSYLGRHLARELDAILPRDLKVDAVVPLPLHWRRAWTRGYNQAAEIARPLARHRGWLLEEMLVRRRATQPQSGLDRAGRKHNLRRAFVARRRRRRFRGSGKRLLLVDDVYTTGATLEAAARVLRAEGARWVGAAVACRTPDSKH
ncbi:MAG: ComF family protein [bacterium]|nr:ComF family protein [bacterium]